MPNVVLINVFEVPEGQEEAFLTQWQAAAAHLRNAEGFVSTRLHESLDPKARFRFVNVAEWASPQHFQAAMQSAEFQAIARQIPATGTPALYRVAVEDPPRHQS